MPTVEELREAHRDGPCDPDFVARLGTGATIRHLATKA